MEKKEIRRFVFARRKSLSQEEIAEKSSVICKKIIALPEFQKADCIYTYMDYNGEVCMQELIRSAWQLGKKVAAPKVSGETMDYFYITSYDDLHPGYFQIPEPDAVNPADDENALLIVPGVGFDASRNRCGYGKGFYDRYLSVHPHHTTVAAAFDFQIVEEVPSAPHDIRPQYLFTEERTFADPDTLLTRIGADAKNAEVSLRRISTNTKNETLLRAAAYLEEYYEQLIAANEKDLAAAKKNGMPDGLQDRLALNKDRIYGMSEGLRQIAALDDPIGEIEEMKKRPNGLMIGQKRVPLGVVGIIYESRPNVTADAFGLCFKTGNAAILKGGSDAIHSNQAIVSILRKALHDCGVCENAVSLIESTDRETTTRFMQLREYVDVLIPRGSARLIQAVVKNSTIPVIETGTGNCHIYVDESANLDMAVQIINNAKTQRIGVCNACESIVVHEKIEKPLLAALKKKLDEHHVELRCDSSALDALGGISDHILAASEKDWGTEYLDYILSVKTVRSLDEAILHINRYNTGHSEAIITENYSNALRFLDEIDAAAVYVNASTRFTDGFEFGFGAEIGISTQKLHARGPMGLKALTTVKYIIFGNGQVRP